MVSRFGGARRAALIFVLALTLAGAFTSAALSQAGGGDDPLAGLSLPGTDDYRALADRMGTTPEPEQSTAAEREASATDYAALSDAQALDLFQAEGAAILDAELFPQVDPPAGAEVSYPDRFTAIVGDDLPAAGHDDPTKASFDPGAAPLSPSERGRNVMIESTVPLVAPENGELAPVDGDLVADGDHFEADNPAVDAEIPVELDRGIALEAPGVTVTPASTEGAEGVAVSDAVFYPSTDVDTDTLVTPTPTGVEVFWQLRSADSPQSNAIDLELPAGAVLRTAGDGAEVLGDGETLVSIPPAKAWDAAGAPVEVGYEVSGATLTVVSPHRDEEVLYPVYVDPIIDYYPFTGGDSTATHYWYAHTSNPEHFNPFYDPLYGALRTRAAPGFYYNEEWAQWVATPIGQSYIETVEFLGIGNWPSDTSGGGAGSCTWASIWSGSFWAEGYTWNSVTNSNSYDTGAWLCGTINDENWSHYTGWNPYPDGEGGDPESADGSVGIFGFYSTGDTFRPGYAENMLRGANVWRGDRNSPGIPSLPTSEWTNNPQIPLNDAGLGVAGYGVYHRPTNTWPGGGGPGCNGSHQSPCPQSTSLAMTNVPEGRHSYELQAYDPLWNSSPMVGWEARVDRSAPTVDPLGGSLVANKDNVLPDQSYTLDITARDGDLSSGDAMRSGVRSIEVLIDGENQPRAGNSWTQDCPGADGSCSLTAQWSMNGADFSPGQHTIRISARDQVGNSDGLAKVLTVDVREDTTRPVVSLAPSPPASDGSSTVTVEATDPGTVATGVTHMEVYADGQLLASFDQECPTGGCPMTRTVQLTPEQSAAVVDLGAVADDGYGNTVAKVTGAKAGNYEYLGFNEEIWFNAYASRDQIRQKVRQVGGNTIRFYLDWCSIVDGAAEGHPEDWNWNRYGLSTFFEEIKAVNTNGPSNKEDDVQVVALLLDAPRWASGASTPCRSPIQPPDGNHLAAWRDFVDRVLGHFGDANYGIVALEAWNEPNLDPFRIANETRYAELVNRAYNAVDAYRTQHPDRELPLKLLSGAMSPLGSPKPKAYLNAALPSISDFDGAGVHLFTDFAKNDRDSRQKIKGQYDDVKDALQAQGRGAKPIWVTELGFPSENDDARGITGSPESQNARLRDTYMRFDDRNQVKAFIIHRLIDAEAGGYGLLEETLAPKPAYCGLADLVGAGPDGC